MPVSVSSEHQLLDEIPLARIAGGAAVSAGGLLVVAQLGQLATLDRADLLATMADPLFRVSSIGYAAAFAVLLVSLAGVHLRQARAAGTFGLVGFIAAAVGTMALGADMWFEAFCSPWLMEALPQLLSLQKALIWQVGYTSSFVLFALGWVLFGISSLRAGAVPRVISLAIVVGGAVGFFAAQPPFALPLGLAVAALGAWTIRSRRGY
jgi:hypothetical protein